MDPLRPGDPGQVGGYELLGRLGAGGMGQVYCGRSRGGRLVAVKLIRAEHAGDRRFRERFAREVAAARRVSGFYTAPVVDADPDADPPWMVTAYIPGPSLRRLVDEHGPLSAGEVRALGAGLAEGLAAVHDRGLVHRDLKPANVIMADDGPRIIDFGIARVLDAGAMTTAGAVFGTFAYMSPEHVNGQPVGPAGDVFSLGSVLTFAATGRSPFDAAAIPAIARRITEGEPDLGGVTGGLRDLIAACLAKDPADRPTVDEVLTGLTPVIRAAAAHAAVSGPADTAPDGPEGAGRPGTPDRGIGSAGAGEESARAADPKGGGLSAGAGAGLVLFALLMFGALMVGVGYAGTDIEIAYAMGTRPDRRAYWAGETLSWRIPAGGGIDTTWRLPSEPGPLGFDGTLRRSPGVPKGDCTGRVEWVLATDRTRAAGGVMTFGRDETVPVDLRPFKIRNRPRTVRLTARRLDRGSCAIHLDWDAAGLDAPGVGPLRW